MSGEVVIDSNGDRIGEYGVYQLVSQGEGYDYQEWAHIKVAYHESGDVSIYRVRDFNSMASLTRDCNRFLRNYSPVCICCAYICIDFYGMLCTLYFVYAHIDRLLKSFVVMIIDIVPQPNIT